MYNDAAEAILFWFCLACLVLFTLAWIVYWSPRGFRFSPPKPHHDWKWWTLRIVLIYALMGVLVPVRRLGDWRNSTTGKVPMKAISRACDRNYFGYTPSYKGVWELNSFKYYKFSHMCSPEGREIYSSKNYHWSIEWWVLIVQLAVVPIILLPFLRMEKRGDIVEWH